MSRDILRVEALPKQYETVLATVYDNLPAATSNAEAFNKSASQFKVATLDVADLTPINAARHLLAVIQQTRLALEEASIKLRRAKLALRKKEDAVLCASGLDADELLIDIDELKMQIINGESMCKGALRKLAHAIAQYKGILRELDMDCISEADFEKDQVRFHIMTAFNQALTASRSRGGVIDEGNHIYFMQLGINGAAAQAEVLSLLQLEQELLQQGELPGHQLIVDWLNNMADKYEQCPGKYSKTRGMPLLREDLLIEIEGAP